jgi:hypothetical protein
MHNRVGERGATLLDVVVGSALMMIVFTGIVGAFQLTVDAVSNNKARAGAIALANERLEYIRSLSYNAIGTSGGIPSGALAQVATSSLNSVLYTRRTFVSWEDDPQDGTGAGDTNGVVTDYKAAKVSVSWESRQGTREITMATRISPPSGVEQAVPGGTLSFIVTNDADQPVSNASVRIFNAGVSPVVDLTTLTDANGAASVLGAPAGAGYQVSATKAGYSISQTYSASSTNTNPVPGHLGVALNQTTAQNFEIDLLSSLTVETFEAVREEDWDDSFDTTTEVASSTGIVVMAGTAELADLEGSHPASGELVSVAIAPEEIGRWKEVSFAHTKPANTDIRYRLYDSAYNWIPDSALAGNSSGFTTSPIDISGLATSTYSQLRIGAVLSGDTTATPSIEDWEVTYDVGPTPLPDISFTVQGAKTIGSGPGGPVYKYSQTHSSGSTAGILIEGIEYDSYSITVPAASGFDVASSCGPQPTVVSPSTNVLSRLYLTPHTTNSLLVDVKNAAGALLPGATVRLQRAPYDTTVTADQCGQAFFSNLSAGSVGGGNPYTIDVSASGQVPYSSAEVNVSGTTRLPVILN